jgi:hypothetical protein
LTSRAEFLLPLPRHEPTLVCFFAKRDISVLITNSLMAFASRPNRPYYDSRVQLRSAYINGRLHGYLYANLPPPIHSRGTVILIHGFPGVSFGQRYQIAHFTSLGLPCIAIDCLGYDRFDPQQVQLQALCRRHHRTLPLALTSFCAPWRS